jgi:hypothetical protein
LLWLFGGGAHGDGYYSLEIHVPQASAAGALIVRFGDKKLQSWTNDRLTCVLRGKRDCRQCNGPGAIRERSG